MSSSPSLPPEEPAEDPAEVDESIDSTDEGVDSAPGERDPQRLKHLGLFLLTLASVFFAGAQYEVQAPTWWDTLTQIHRGWTFAVPLMAILVTHEFGHYFAAMAHKVPASLPFFIPLPVLSPFGTMGAVISMPSRIGSRNALLDIGAAGPIAGLVVAIPVLVIGLSQSEVRPMVEAGGMYEGQSLLYWAIKRMVLGPIPPGHDVYINATAFAGWVGLLITTLNMLPIGQLDGGHIAYALFDKAQNKYGRILHWGLLAAFGYNIIRYQDASPGMVWLLWFFLLFGMRRLSGGIYHPPTEPGELSRGRKVVAVACLLLFVLLFMPTPVRIYQGAQRMNITLHQVIR